MSQTVEPTIGTLLQQYILSPNMGRLLPLRSAIRSLSQYDPNLNLDAVVRPLLDTAQSASAGEALDALVPVALLSPRFHLLRREFALRVGDMDAEREASVLWGFALRAILETGDGTTRAPWSVLMVGDEYDVLQHLGCSARGQRLAEREGRWLDVIESDDGREFWFELVGE